MQITVVRSGSSCPLGEVLEHSEKVGPGGGGVAYICTFWDSIDYIKVLSTPFGGTGLMDVQIDPAFA